MRPLGLLHLAVPFGVLAAALAPALAAQPAPSFVLHNARVFTADPAQPWAEAVAVAGERIAAVGTNADVLALAGEGTRVLDLGGRLIVPGLNDAHVHGGPWPEVVRLDFGPSPMTDPGWGEVVSAVAAAAPGAPDGQWIYGRIGPAALDDPAATRFALDGVAAGHPVMLWGWTGHGMVLNTAALERLGIALDAADVPGGAYDRADGTLTGRMREYADVGAARRLAEMEPPKVAVAAYRALADEAARYGITTVQHMANDLPLDDVLAALREADVPIRWSVFRWPMPVADVAEGWSELPVTDTGIPRVSVVGAKWMLDGTPVERGAAMRQAYADRPGWHGRLNFSPEAIRRILAASLERGERLALHIAGDSTAAVVLRAMAEIAPAERWRPLRVRIEHGDGLAPDLVPLAADLGAVLVQNPTHLSLSEVMPARLGAGAAAFQPLRSALEAGIPVALGSDAGGPAFSPFLNLMLATMHPARPDEALSLEQALTAYTRGSAYAEGAEAEKGTLREGMLADFAVLSQNLFETPPDAWPATESVLTMVGGAVVYQSGAPGGGE